ncbi:MAG: hypothetical protein U5O39_12915 [Gammaproteobacteria bacterium]|nr:hypothetical protein [Gammaproteobacteria bacterium]
MSESSEHQQDIKERMRRGDLSASNKEVLKAFAIDPYHDPWSKPLGEMDPGHPSLFQHDTLWDHFKRLRQEDPVHYTEDSMFRSILVGDEVQGHYGRRHQSQGVFIAGEQGRHRARRGRKSRSNGRELSSTDVHPGRPAEARRAAQRSCRRCSCQATWPSFEPLIRSRADYILDNLPRNEEFNWVREVSVELTGQMLATLFDVPQEDRLKLIHWSDTVQNLGDPDYFDTPEEGFAELFNCLAYFSEYYEARESRKNRNSTSFQCWRTTRPRTT